MERYGAHGHQAPAEAGGNVGYARGGLSGGSLGSIASITQCDTAQLVSPPSFHQPLLSNSLTPCCLLTLGILRINSEAACGSLPEAAFPEALDKSQYVCDHDMMYTIFCEQEYLFLTDFGNSYSCSSKMWDRTH